MAQTCLAPAAKRRLGGEVSRSDGEGLLVELRRSSSAARLAANAIPGPAYATARQWRGCGAARPTSSATGGVGPAALSGAARQLSPRASAGASQACMEACRIPPANAALAGRATVKNRVKIAFRAIFPHKTIDRPEMLCYSMCYLSCERFLFVRFFTRKGRLRTYREAMPAPLGPGK